MKTFIKLIIGTILIVATYSCTTTQKTITSSENIANSEWVPKSFDDAEKWFDEQHSQNLFTIKDSTDSKQIILTIY